MDHSHSLSSRRNIVTSPLVLPTSVASTSKVTSSTLDDSTPASTGTPASNPQLDPPPLGASASSRHGQGSSSSAAGNDQMYIKRHIRRRLAHAKENCDKELKNIINSITAYVEERIQDMDYDDLGSAIAPSETGSDDGGTEADLDIPTSKHSRHPSTANSSPNSFRRHPALPGRSSNVNYSPSESPNKRSTTATPQHTTPTKTTQPAPGGGSSGSTIIGRRLSRSLRGPPPIPIPIPISNSSSRSPSRSRSPMLHGSGGSGSAPDPNASSAAGGLSSSPRLHIASRRLSKYATEFESGGSSPQHATQQSSPPAHMQSWHHSQTASPSVSTQHLHPASAATPVSSSQQQQQTGSQISSGTIDRDGYQSQTFMGTLQAVIVIATDVIDLPIARLTSEPHACSKIVHRVQALGRAWDEHPDWHGRTWYVQLLLAVASLSRVVEWFEAERQFWNFDEAPTSVAGRESGWDETGDEEGGEMLTFVLKPVSRDTASALNSAITPSSLSAIPSSGSASTAGGSGPGSVLNVSGALAPTPGGGALGMTTSSSNTSTGGASTPNTDGGNDGPALSRVSSVHSSGRGMPATSMGPPSSTTTSTPGIARFQPPAPTPAPSAPPQRPTLLTDLTASTSPARGGGEFENFGSSVIADEDAAPHERDLDFDDETIPPLPLPPTSLQEEEQARDAAKSSQDETIAPAQGEQERGHEYEQSGDHPDDEVTNADRAEASEVLRVQAEQAQSLNVVLELTLDGEGGQQFAWINPAWYDVIGTDPDTLLGTPIADHLAPADADVFREATRQLQEDDSHTLEVQFRIKVKPQGVDEIAQQEDAANGRVWFREMEGKGMLMYDRADGTPSHTMWVIKPLGPPELLTSDGVDLVVADGEDGGPTSGGPGFHRRGPAEPVTPFPYLKEVPTGSILCRICELEIPSWFFVKHNDTCNETHRIEASVAECNESISELRHTVRELREALDRPGPGAQAEYRGIPIFSPAPSPSNPISQFFKPPLGARLQKASVRKLQHKLLSQIEDILQVAVEISMPALQTDQSAEPIERQRLLSPESLDRITQARNWVKPTSDDAALAQLVEDASMLVHSKLEEVNRLSNTLRYAEKVRQEWEDDFLARQRAMEAAVEASKDHLTSLSSAGAGSEMGDVSSTTSEYAFDADNESYSHPTPMRAASPVPFRPRGTWRSPLIPFNHPSSSHLSISRASTPPSISSPLAVAAPIVASHDERAETSVTGLNLNINPLAVQPAPPPPTNSAQQQPTPIQSSTSQNTVRGNRSATAPASSGLEPKFLVTPPVSPLISPQEPVIRGHQRKLSNLPALSPVSSSSGNGIPQGPLSPRITTSGHSRATPSSIKDFDIIKPISKGAFGSVFLAKKKVTGDYYAIKVLRKADMISKNQITNVKAERMILMKQAESPFVVKLYYTFQSKDNLYLVMEYLNGGDCAALIKAIGSLPEEWAKGYVAEVVLGLEYLHARGVIHRDLKPDNLLIDSQGHLKLTDFGLSRIGLLNRQTRESRQGSEPKHASSSRSTSVDAPRLSSPPSGEGGSRPPSYFNLRGATTSQHTLTSVQDDISESSGSESLSASISGLFRRKPSVRRNKHNSPVQSFSDLTNDLRSRLDAHKSGRGASGAPEPRFVGTPDYLAPEVVLGYGGEDRAVDWWALGVITYEFLYGVPPFHDDAPEKVFENIISRKVEWHDDWVEFSPDARDFMERLMCTDPEKRLGYNGAQEVKEHPFFNGVDWEQVMTAEPQFVPQVTDPESTDYFDPRGAIPQLFHDEDAIAVTGRPSPTDSPRDETAPSSSRHSPIQDRTASPSNDEFGTFNFKNLPVLKQANDELIRKMQASPPSESSSSSSPMVISQALGDTLPLVATATSLDRRRSISQRGPKVVPTPPVPPPPPPPPPQQHGQSVLYPMSPPSPTNSTSSIGSGLSRAPSTPASTNTGHVRRPSEYGPVERFKQSHMDHDGHRRNSMPSRLRTSSMSSADFAGVDPWPASEKPGGEIPPPTPSSTAGPGAQRRPRDQSTVERVVTCLLAEDNPISIKILETLLTRMGCHCILVSDGAEAISVALGDIKFDLILMDLNMPNVDGETAARYIKSTNNKNASTPVVAVSAYSLLESDLSNSVFVASLSKPVQRVDLLAVFKQLGFRISTQESGKRGSKIRPR